MERVFAKYEKIKNIMEGFLEERDSKVRRLFSDGLVHIFDAENPIDEDSSPKHRLNIGIYNQPLKVKLADSANTIFFDSNLSEDILRQQFKFLINSNGSLLDVAFGLDKEKYEEFKKNINELKKVEMVLNKVHSFHVPLRIQEFNNFKFFSKYLVGESVGGDFFDIEEVDKKIYFFLASFNSYVTSVNFIKNISDIKQRGGDIYSGIANYISQVKKDIKGVFFMETDPKKLDVKYLNYGNFYIKSSTSSFKQENGSHVFSDGESLILGSTGFKELTSNFDHLENVNMTSDREISKLYNEYFSQLNSKKSGRFLPCDSTLISIVLKNKVIKEVE